MRQRFLLVAGWAAAAAVAMVVSSGAVSVAGGQVSDRPLRALSASEVAALSAASGGAGTVGHEPLASGGFVPTGTAPADAATTDEAPASEPSSAGDGEDAAALGATAPTYPVDPSDGDESVSRSVTRIADLRGGRVAYRGSNGEVFTLWRLSNPGYGSIVEMADDHSSMRVTFSNGRRESILNVTWTDHGIEATKMESG